jgi:hypothetical protein
LLVFRSGSANQFRWQGQIKNVYRGASATVGRLLLLRKEFTSLGEFLEQTRALDGRVTLPTVSKVCKSLEQDLIIERTPGQTRRSRGLRLLQPEKLLDLLGDNYVPPEVGRVWTGKYTGTPQSLVERLSEWEQQGEGRVVLSGASSVQSYAVMAREPLQTFYCSDVTALTKSFGSDLVETDRFADIRFLETRDDFVYFDRREGLVASPVQTYLELATGEKRERETAEQVRRLILSQLAARTNAR